MRTRSSGRRRLWQFVRSRLPENWVFEMMLLCHTGNGDVKPSLAHVSEGPEARPVRHGKGER
ncbi:hypothetical protein BOSEA31B_13361 [Hyphomicrobiales bacterium]|nr:hypothetical protein BOSEA31B_13361 [Hyphomicrobiales bacterium]CAH1699133.1 hypothetical protein BOSEA1005_12186 [Hyphomicrobiales bacterium]CAI0342923.1 hypothetical protein BO1005MUT1_200068 [Hyphomicrobiales bacterium]